MQPFQATATIVNQPVYELTLRMDAESALVLKGMLQNPLWPGELVLESHIRQQIFNAIHQVVK